eukprot:TRINITY_DN28530_c0_g1_i1.p2 TRINITY_DN28530_c0_g1~~TRINITY_DN28530_c0_g1_i1.p2  ORF type:complete len:136 (+),score=34.50 TRINITY_DN28530_c0_g1_i1:124-531(+)
MHPRPSPPLPPRQHSPLLRPHPVVPAPFESEPRRPAESGSRQVDRDGTTSTYTWSRPADAPVDRTPAAVKPFSISALLSSSEPSQPPPYVSPSVPLANVAGAESGASDDDMRRPPTAQTPRPPPSTADNVVSGAV